MNQGEFIKAVAGKVNATEKRVTETLVKDVVNSTVEVITEAVAKGDKVSINGLGSFEAAVRAARDGRNPITGETIHIEEKKVPKFKAAKAFKEAVK